LAYGSADVTVVLLNFFSIYMLLFILFLDAIAKILPIAEKGKQTLAFLVGF
jgi:hypothetical protein